MFNYVLVHVAALRGGGKWTRRCLCIHSQAVILDRSGNPMLLHCRYCYFVDSLSAIELVSMELSLLVQKRLKDILTSAMPNWTRTFWPFNCGMHVCGFEQDFLTDNSAVGNPGLFSSHSWNILSSLKSPCTIIFTLISWQFLNLNQP